MRDGVLLRVTGWRCLYRLMRGVVTASMFGVKVKPEPNTGNKPKTQWFMGARRPMMMGT